jgi:hypothetical protein
VPKAKDDCFAFGKKVSRAKSKSNKLALNAKPKVV